MKYIITAPVKKVIGYQQWSVEAESREIALRIYEKGEGEFIHEEINVEELGKPEIEEDRS